jgi:hypothetical protein
MNRLYMEDIGYELLHTVGRAGDSHVGSPRVWPGIGSGLNSYWQHVFSGTDRPSGRWHHGIPRHPYLFLRDLHEIEIIYRAIEQYKKYKI